METSGHYRSLDALVDEHSALLRQYMSGEVQAVVPNAKDFVTRAVRTGLILESMADREAAQTLTTLPQRSAMENDDVCSPSARRSRAATAAGLPGS